MKTVKRFSYILLAAVFVLALFLTPPAARAAGTLTLNINGGNIIINGSTVYQEDDIYDLNNYDDFVITGSSSGNTVTVVAATKHPITLRDLAISSTTSWSPLFIDAGASATLVLDGDHNTCDTYAYSVPAIYVPSGAQLTIQGSGKLSAVAHTSYAAGIGGVDGGDCGTVIINGGTITATGNDGGAGIGGGAAGNGGTVEINDGTVTAKGDGGGAGIGGGNGGAGGTVTISGGTVSATGSLSGTGVSGGAGIGGGYGGSGGTVEINDGTVTAKGGPYSAGIGGGENGSGGTVKINGGTVLATGNTGGAGIGGGDSGNGGTVEITGGMVTISGGTGARALGAGKNKTSANINVKPAAGKSLVTRVSDTRVTKWNTVILHQATLAGETYDYDGDSEAYGKRHANIGEWYSMSGTVFGSDTGAGLSGASVKLMKGTATVGNATTAANGAYAFTSVPGGTGYTVEVSMTNYYPGTIPAFNVSAAVSNKNITLTKIPAVPTITTDALPGGTVGEAYSFSLAATGDAPIAWSVSSGTLPAGLTLGADGTLSGVLGTEGTSTFTVKATNDAGDHSKSLTLAVHPAPAAPTITTDALPDGVVGEAYSFSLAATGDAPISWSVSSGTLPAGLTLGADGTLSGVLSTAGTSTFTVKATNDAGDHSKSLTLAVHSAPAAPTITTDALPGGTVGEAYSFSLAATGDAPIAWSVSSGTLPAGLTLGADGTLSGVLGTEGTSTFTVKAINDAGDHSKSLTLAVVSKPTAATPVFQPAAGTYSKAQGLSVSISCLTPGAVIRYTTNGNDPTNVSARYSVPLSFSSTTVTVKARAFKQGMADSAVASATYTVKPVPAVVLKSGSASFVKGGAAQDTVFTIGANIAGFNATNNYAYTTVGGTTLTASQVKASDGSIILAFQRDYLNTLSAGTHTALVHLKGAGYAGTTVEMRFTVSAAPVPPVTGDAFTPVLWLALCLLAGCGLCALIRRKRQITR